MKVLIYTNCQGSEIQKYLKSSTEFNLKYKVTSVFMPHWYNDESVLNGGVNQTSTLPESLIKELQSSDLFIHQPFSTRRGVFTTYGEKSVLKYLKSSCRIISFPSLYADIFPIYTESRSVKGLYCIKKLLDSGVDKSRIIQMYNNLEINFELNERFKFSMDFMRIKEKDCLIIASKFIESNIKHVKLFDMQNHPTEILNGYISNEILKLAELEPTINYMKLERFMINNVCYSESSYMKKELDMQYMKQTSEEHYLNLLTDYLNGNLNFNLIEPFKTIYQ